MEELPRERERENELVVQVCFPEVAVTELSFEDWLGSLAFAQVALALVKVIQSWMRGF